MILFHILALALSLTYIVATLALMLWGFLSLTRIIRRRLTPMVWVCFGALAFANAALDAAYSLYPALGFDLLTVAFAYVMLRRSRPVRVA